ncbi:MAG TPA: pilus assembly protein N-terminal domain-containing protein [Gammaproteobacteria bacterium]|nr:pilus assembly protein N-terminal domain-containing protein [Gammaproteobacteria bacterium]
MLALFRPAAQAAPALELFVGQVKIMQPGPVERVAVGNGGLLSTTILENGQLVVLAESAGITDMHIWRESGREDHYTVTIGEEEPRNQTQEVHQLLDNIPGVSVRKVGKFVVVEGELDERFRPALDTVKKQYPGMLDLTQQAAVKTNSPMIHMDVKITEFNTNKLEELGVEWSSSINGPAIGYMNQIAYKDAEFNHLQVTDDKTLKGLAGDLGDVTRPLGFFGIGGYLASRINFLVSSGDALILAQPRLSARSGGKADFLAGGQVPIPITGDDGQLSVEYKKYGISLTISPATDGRGHIQANVETEVSALDPSTSVQGLPGFLTRKTNADVAMQNGETLVISGLVNHELSDQVDELPGLADLPVLGRLFRSNDFRHKRTELVIFVTPRVYDPASELNKEAVARGDELVDEFMTNTGRELILE